MARARRRGASLGKQARVAGVLAFVAVVDVAGALTAAFSRDTTPGSCEPTRPAAVLVDASTAAVAGDPVAKYAPLVYLAPSERFLPMPADCFLDQSELGWARPLASDQEVFTRVAGIDHERLGGAQGDYSAADPELFRSHEFTRPFAAGRARLGDRRGFYLDVDDDFRYGNAPSAEDGALAGTPVYYEFVPGRYVTYWFFYGFSAPAGAKQDAVAGILGHEGDWERITVRLEGTTATEVAYYQHGGEPKPIAYDQVLKRGTHPVVFSGRASHASYGSGGYHSKDGDRTGRGREWQTWLYLANATKQPWYRYGGAWGVVRNVRASVKSAARRLGFELGEGEFTGPSGPCSKRPAPTDWLIDPTPPVPGPGVCAPR